MTAGSDIVTIEQLHDRLSIGESAREQFQDDQRQLIRRTIAPDAPEDQFDLFLEIAARYQLNPLMQEIHLAGMPGRGGNGKQYVAIVGHAGWNTLANRYSDYRGKASDVRREGDNFHVEWGDVEWLDRPKVLHSWGSEPELNEEGAFVSPTRGKIVGAWCKVYRAGHAPGFFYAPWGEYAPNDISRNKAWRDTPTAMITKVAEATAMRRAFSLGGLYDQAEIDHMLEARGGSASHDLEPEWGDDPALAEWLRRLVAAVNEARPGAYRPAKVRQVLRGRSQDDREAFAQQLADELVMRKIDPPPRPVFNDDGEELVDGEVVNGDGDDEEKAA